MATRYILRRDTSADWADANPILAVGEPGVETDTKRFKIGDGVAVWTALPYAADGTGSAAAAQAAAQTYADGKVTAEVTRANGAYDATGAAGAAQAFAVQRANHSGTQPATTITGLDAAVAGAVTPGGSATAAAIAADPALRAAFVPVRSHASISPLAGVQQNAGGREVCGVDAQLGKVWAFNSTALYQVDSLTATNWAAVTLPANVAATGADGKIVTYTPSGGSKLMFLVSWNSSTSRYEVYSATPTARTVAPTWSSVLLQLSQNATLIPTAIRACSTGLFVGEYSAGTNEIPGGPSVWRSVDGATWTKVLGPLGSTTRHIHGVFEDPFNLGTIYVSVGDAFPPYAPPFFLYKSTDGGATFTGVPTLTNGIWQCVSMGFTAEGIWLCSDQPSGAGPVFLDRATLTPRWATTKARHDRIPVPGGASGRYISDLAMTSGSATVTSATANFTSQDKGRIIAGNNAIPIGTFIASVTNATTAVLSASLSNTQGSQPAFIAGDTFYASAYAGAVDPATGWLYVVANDSSVAGTTAGIFVMPGRDQPFTLLYPLYSANLGHFECYIAGGYLWVERYGPMPLLTP